MDMVSFCRPGAKQDLDAASATGDARIPKRTQGQVARRRERTDLRRGTVAGSRGYQEGRPAVCDTFSGSI
jgi:predicted metalloprotease